MGVGLEPQAVLRGLSQVAPEDSVQVFEQRFGTPDHHREQSQHAELVRSAADAEAGQQ